MKDLSLSLILLDINKRDIKLILTLYSLYLLYLEGDKKQKKVFKIRDLVTLTGISGLIIASSLDNLIDYNIMGKLEFDVGSIVSRKIVKKFNTDFLATLENKQKPVTDAMNRVGFYITDDTKIYVLNPQITTWKYPTWKKIGKLLKSWNEAGADGLVTDLIKNKDTGKHFKNNEVRGMSIKKSLLMFADAFKKNYKATYQLNWTIESKLMKDLLKQLAINNISGNSFSTFLDYAFDKALSKGAALHINHLKYYANEFVSNLVPKSAQNSNFYYDDSGVLRRRNK